MKFLVIILSFISTVGIIINLGPEMNLYNHIVGDSLLLGSPIFAILIFYLLYNFYTKNIYNMKIKYLWLLGIALSLMFLIGYSMAKCGSLDLLFAKRQIGKFIISFIAYTILFTFTIGRIFKFFDNFNVRYSEIGEKRINGIIVRNPFKFSFFVIIAWYLPLLVISYPGLCIYYDLWSMIAQGYNYSEYTSEALNLISNNVKLNSHHSVLYTLFLVNSVKLGLLLFKSANLGILFVSIIQLIFFSIVVSFGIKLLVKNNVNILITYSFLIYCLIAPNIQKYMFFTTKDTLYGSFFLLFILGIYCNLRYNNTFSFCIVTLSGILCCLLRNDAKYIICGSFIIIILTLYKKINVNHVITSFVFVLITTILYYNIVLPLNNVTGPNIREMLSVPFQQSARYIKYYPNEVTIYEKNIINTVLNYDYICANYNPEISDPVKNTFNKNCDKDDLKKYFGVWKEMFYKHPKVYLEAFLNNYYNYFYPGYKPMTSEPSFYYSKVAMQQVNTDPRLNKHEIFISHIHNFEKIQYKYEKVREKIFSIPIINIINNTAIYVWLLLCWMVYVIQRKYLIGICLCIPLFLCLCVCFLGPCNGDYFRYIYPIYISMPLVMILGLCSKEIMKEQNMCCKHGGLGLTYILYEEK